MKKPPTNQGAAPGANEWMVRSHIQTLALLVVTAFLIYLCSRLVAPFLPALAWALVLAVLFTPFQRWLESKIKHPNLAAALSVVVIAVTVIFTATLVGQRLILQAVKGAELVESKFNSGEWRHALEAQPRLSRLADWLGSHVNLPEIAKSFTAWLSASVGSVLKGSVFQMIGFGLTFYLLFFFLRDRRMALQALRSISPLSGTEMDKMLSRIGATINATIYGTLAVAAVQGFLGGLMFWWLGLPAPVLWGVIMALLAVVPMMGAFIVWIPAAFFLASEGSWGKAVILTFWGLLVVGLIDNLLRPYLVGDRLKLHTVFVFISVVGGLALFGPAGLIFGPVVLTFTIVLLEIWSARINATEQMRHL